MSNLIRLAFKALAEGRKFVDAWQKNAEVQQDNNRLVNNMGRDLADLSKEIERHGESNPELLYSVEVADSHVRKERKRVRRRGKKLRQNGTTEAAESSRYKLRPTAKFFGACCSSKATESMRIAEDCVKRPAEILRRKEENRAALQNSAQIPLPYISVESREDLFDRHIPMKKTEKDVMEALLDLETDPSKLIWLYGGVGTGKSLVIEKLCRQLREMHQRGAEGTFQDVVYLACDRQFDRKEKKRDILRCFGGWTVEVSKPLKGKNLKSALTKALNQRGRWLIVIDNLFRTSAKFLQKLLDLSGANVIFLVASREKYDWKLNAKCKPIKMQDVELSDAREILAAHMTPEKRLIPNQCEVVLNKIIRQTGGNPLALACIGASLGAFLGQSHGENDQKDADKLNKHLECGETADRLKERLECDDTALVCSRKYPLSYWSALEKEFKDLTDMSQMVLLLVTKFHSPDAHVEVVEFLIKNTRAGQSGNFATSKGELGRQGLVKISQQAANYSGIPGHGDIFFDESWSLDPLLRLFLDHSEYARSKTISLCRDLAEGRCGSGSRSQSKEVPETWMLHLLRALYLKPEFAGPLVDPSPSKWRNILRGTDDERMEPMEPMEQTKPRKPRKPMDLSMKDVVEPLVKEYMLDGTNIYFKQVIVDVICVGKLPVKAVSALLRSDKSCWAMLATLNRLLRSTNDITVSDDIIDESAVMKLLCMHKKNALEIYGEYCPRLRKYIRDALVRMAKQKDDMDAYRTGNGALDLDLLITLVISNCTASEFSSALADLADGGRDIGRRIVKNEEAMKGLVDKLISDSANAQKEAARIFARLTEHDDVEIFSGIRNVPKALVTLLSILLNSRDPSLQIQASFAVCKLVPVFAEDHSHATEVVLTMYVDRLGKLVEVLAESDNDLVQTYVAITLEKLARMRGKSMVRIPKVVLGLVTALSTGNQGVQERAARALVHLTAEASGDDLLSRPNDLSELENALITAKATENIYIKEGAVMALQKLEMKTKKHGIGIDLRTKQQSRTAVTSLKGGETDLQGTSVQTRHRLMIRRCDCGAQVEIV